MKRGTHRWKMCSEMTQKGEPCKRVGRRQGMCEKHWEDKNKLK